MMREEETGKGGSFHILDGCHYQACEVVLTEGTVISAYVLSVFVA